MHSLLLAHTIVTCTEYVVGIYLFAKLNSGNSWELRLTYFLEILFDLILRVYVKTTVSILFQAVILNSRARANSEQENQQELLNAIKIKITEVYRKVGFSGFLNLSLQIQIPTRSQWQLHCNSIFIYIFLLSFFVPCVKLCMDIYHMSARVSPAPLSIISWNKKQIPPRIVLSRLQTSCANNQIQPT